MASASIREDLSASARWEASASIRLRDEPTPILDQRDRAWVVDPAAEKEAAHPAWLSLDWTVPVRVSEIVIEQQPAGATAFQVEVRDTASSDWNVAQRFDGGGKRLPPRVLCTLPGRVVAGVRIAEIQGPAAIRTVGVFSDSLPTATSVASDANGNIIGVVSDGHGYAPCPGAAVVLEGRSATGPWRAETRTNDWGLFAVPMPLGLRGTVRVLTDGSGRTARSTLRAEDLQYGLTPTSFTSGAPS